MPDYVTLTHIMTTETTHSSTLSVTMTKKERSTVEISGELPFTELETHRATAVARVSEHVKLDGFRPGHIPEAILLKEVGEMVILEEMARMAISKTYPRIITDNAIDAIGNPEIIITKLAAGSPLGFSITTAVMPNITLPDYKKIAATINKKKESVAITDEEVETTIANVLKHKNTNHVHDETCDHTHETTGKNTDANPVELTDEVAQSLGDFANIADLRAKVKKNIHREKERHMTQTHRGALIDAIIAEMKADIPDIIIEGELDRMMAQFENDIARMGLKFDAYLEHIKKTRNDLRNEWRSDGEKSAKTQFMLTEIAKVEHLSPDKERADTETQTLMEQHTGTPEHHIRDYVDMVLTNDTALAFLEGVK